MKFLDLFEDNTAFAEADIPDNFEVNPAQRTLADIGRKLMDKAATTKDDALSTALSRVGNELTSYGTVFGASNIQELEKKTGIKRDSIMKMMDYGKRMLNKEGAARIADKPVAEAVGAASDAFYDMMDAMTGGQEPPEPFSTIIDEMTRYMSSDQLEDFVADFKRHHGINEAVHEASCEDCGNPSYTTLPEEKQKGVDGKVCWKGYKRMGTKQKGGKTVDNCVKMSEAEDTTEYGIVRYPDTAISYIKKTTNGWEHIFDKSYGFRGPVDKADLTYAKKISREKVPSRLHQA